MDTFGLEQRVGSVLDRIANTKYAQRKTKLQVTFEQFLSSIASDIHQCSGHEVCLFLAWQDANGKTPVHVNTCPQIGDKFPTCQCPRRLALGSVAGKISQLMSIFISIGRSIRNPAESQEVISYFQGIRMEQSEARVTSFQAKPIFLRKLRLIAMYLDRQLCNPKTAPIQRFIFARDQALFKFLFFGGDRAHDAGNMLIQEIRSLPEGSGLLVTHTHGKTHQVHRPNVFSLFNCPVTMICPVRGLSQYIELASSLGVDMRSGYLFRPTCQNKVLAAPLSYEAIYDRLKFYLNILDINGGETPHSFRSGCAITFREFSKRTQGDASSIENVMQHVGWTSVIRHSLHKECQT